MGVRFSGAADVAGFPLIRLRHHTMSQNPTSALALSISNRQYVPKQIQRRPPGSQRDIWSPRACLSKSTKGRTVITPTTRELRHLRRASARLRTAVFVIFGWRICLPMFSQNSQQVRNRHATFAGGRSLRGLCKLLAATISFVPSEFCWVRHQVHLGNGLTTSQTRGTGHLETVLQ